MGNLFTNSDTIKQPDDSKKVADILFSSNDGSNVSTDQPVVLKQVFFGDEDENFDVPTLTNLSEIVIDDEEFGDYSKTSSDIKVPILNNGGIETDIQAQETGKYVYYY